MVCYSARMKIEAVTAEDVHTLFKRTHQSKKYGELYAAIDALKPNEALRLTFDDHAEMQKYRSSIGTRYRGAEWTMGTDKMKFQIGIMRLVVDPNAPPGVKAKPGRKAKG